MGVSEIGVIGAGFMGSGIAQCAAAAGKRVVLYEPDATPLDRSRETILAAISAEVARGRVSRADGDQIIGRIVHTTRFDDLADAECVIEAVTEQIEVKRELFARLDTQFPDARFLASNTSSIPVAELAASTRRPERVLGLHFFSPVPMMKLVEVVDALPTSPETMAEAEALVRDLGKRPIRTQDRSGFIVNMLLVPYLMAAVRMFAEGFASAEDIDEGMKLGCGHPMGPLTLCDFIGLDVIHAIGESLYDEFKRPEYAPPPLLKRMVSSGHLGRKAGRGFYDYTRPVVSLRRAA